MSRSTLPLLRRLVPVLGLAACFAASAAAPPCRVIVGGGSRIPPPTTVEKDFWNRLNFAFFDASQYQLGEQGGGREAIGLFHVVGSPEAMKSDEQALLRAESSGCTEVIRLSVFGDDTANPVEVVFRIAVSPVERLPGTKGLHLGTPTYQHETRFPVDEDVERRVVPSQVAEREVTAYLAATAR